MRTAESCNVLIIMNMSTLLKYAEKRKNVIYAQYQIMMIECVASEKCQQDINALIAIRITQHELQNATRKKNT